MSIDGDIELRHMGGSAVAWTPADLPDVFAWWRADLGITLNGDDVSAWEDQVNGHTLSQGTAIDQPEHEESVAELNNHAAIAFLADFLESDEAASVWAFLSDTGGSVQAVFVPRVTGGPNTIWATNVGSPTSRGICQWWYHQSPEDYLTLLGSNGAARFVNFQTGLGSDIPLNTRALADCEFEPGATGDDWTQRLNTVSVGSGEYLAAQSALDPSCTFRVGRSCGGSYAGKHHLAELIVSDAPLSASSRSKMQAYLTRRYGDF